MTRFLCCGDLHFGAGQNLGADRLAEQQQVWRGALELGREHDVDAVLFAGDAFERRRPTPAELMAFARPLRDFYDLDVVAVVGNHDIESHDRPCGLDVFARVPDAGMQERIQLAREPQLFDVGDVTVCTLPWAPVSRIVAQAGGGDRDDLHRHAAELLVDVARGLRARVDPRRRCVLLTHFSISGSGLPSGLPVDQLREPVLDLNDLVAIGFDAIVAGHIHRAQQIHDGLPGPVFYVGSPMPLNFGEAGVPHGAWILDIPADEPGSWTLTFEPIESRRLVTIDDDLVDFGEPIGVGLASPPGDVDGAIVKLRYRTTAELARRFDVAQARRDLEAVGAYKVHSVEATIEREQRARVAGVDETISDSEALERWLDGQGVSIDDHDARRDLVVQRHARYAEAIA